MTQFGKFSKSGNHVAAIVKGYDQYTQHTEVGNFSNDMIHLLFAGGWVNSVLKPFFLSSVDISLSPATCSWPAP